MNDLRLLQVNPIKWKGKFVEGGGLRLDSEPRPVLVQIQRKSDGFIDLLNFVC